jgi:ABC-type antimicrobial peptide transport system permease subunit
MAQKMGGGSQLGNLITQKGSTSDEDGKMTIVGVVENFVFGNMYGTSPAPIMMRCNPSPYRQLTLRFKPGVDIQKSLQKVEAIMKLYNPDYPFGYKFLDDEFDKLFKTETFAGKLSGVFASLAIFISCLGLFGLASYTASRRTKEISIRKVLGASLGNLTRLLSVDFLRLVIIACLLSFPVAWWIMNEWLKSFEYHTSIQLWVFIGTGLGAFVIAFLTVSLQTIKAAMVNPSRTLRKE